VLGTEPGASTVVGGLPLAVRAVLALREAGFDDVGLVALPDKPRWAADPLARRGVSIRWISPVESSRGPVVYAPTLLLAGDVLVDAAAVAALRDASLGPVRTVTGHVVGEVRCTGNGSLGLDRAELCDRRPDVGTRLTAGLAVPLASARSSAHLERTLLDHLGDRRASDSYLAALVDRPMSRPITRRLLRTPLTPSHVTLLGLAIGLFGAAGLATISYWGRVGGTLLLIVSLVLDCVDGDMARTRLAQDPRGARLDLVGDYVVNLAVFAGLVVGLLREGLPPGGGLAALALVTGVGAAMTAVHFLFLRPVLRRGGDLHWPGDAGSLRGKPGAPVIEKLASRDYTYLLLVLALVGHLDWFLYAAAGGAWLFTLSVVVFGLLSLSRHCQETTSR
jgi:phosphatidylglycerophosphate synthase